MYTIHDLGDPIPLADDTRPAPARDPRAAGVTTPAPATPASTGTSAPVIITDARVLKVGVGPKRGLAMSDLGEAGLYDVLIDRGEIMAVLPSPSPLRHATKPGVRFIDGAKRVLMPGFVDCHTHACFAGSRLDEWDQRRGGLEYLEILRRGGGIMATVRAVRKASQEELAAGLLERLNRMLELGTTTVEVKSGYGLSTHDEMKMLRAIHDAAAKFKGTVVPTALLGHALDPAIDRASFVKSVIEETLPAISLEFPGIAVDAFCEKSAWDQLECLALFDAASERGHPCRVHADQFTSMGMTSIAAQRGFVSVDHIEATSPAELQVLARSSAIGVVLPVSTFHLGGKHASARVLVDAGGAVALATNFNPGSAPCYSMPLAVAFAVRLNGLTPQEAISACTGNAAAVLGRMDRGSVEPGMRADLVVLKHTDERELAHSFGDDPVAMVMVKGEIVRG